MLLLGFLNVAPPSGREKTAGGSAVHSAHHPEKRWKSRTTSGLPMEGVARTIMNRMNYMNLGLMPFH